ncbi:MAG: CoB--CoM heterodisulfide reductase iron-sulfur subunit A family protein [Candidatus Acidulodesulfobacterium acidiphilum]|uniref:CoB--CoM heterodisulfide reductase iron-sulfur subunit A family protein n=1 Tax=Candidatus Acidulodesulfobacterium acidiphilum TaxID=2597224 RepID=A0A520XBN2_9DELT|nr:MAG: CoB--CoM heterodisulfide reductase iron-sulfur subunit A family protein [Candidatus Acidulodesulfobacterium acidiphilum]
MSELNNENAVLIIGGGHSGVSAALEITEAVDKKVYIVEKKSYIGGRVLQMYKYFPKLCPPFCGFEINTKRIKSSTEGNINFLVSSNVEEITKAKEGTGYKVKIKQKPQYINDNCTVCGECAKVCPEERPNDFNYGMDNTKAIYLPAISSFPLKYSVDDKYCKFSACKKCEEACRYSAINLDAKENVIELTVSDIIFATGWKPYEVEKLENLGYGKYKNVITNVKMERLAAENGPTGGKILRPSDRKEVKNVAFIQCAGSRNENHLPYCSAICCMASLKQAMYLRDKNPESSPVIFYIDLRTPGRYENFLNKVKSDEKIKFNKGVVGKISEDHETGDLLLDVEDMISGKKNKVRAEMVVLAAGMASNIKDDLKEIKIDEDIKIDIDENGFIFNDNFKQGIFSAGVARFPLDVYMSGQSATSAALSVIQHNAK